MSRKLGVQNSIGSTTQEIWNAYNPVLHSRINIDENVCIQIFFYLSIS